MTATLYPSRSSRSAERVHVATDRTPNYAVRRVVAVLVAVAAVATIMVAASAIVIALADVGGRPAAASDVASAFGDAPAARSHVAQPGDTLWSIADEYRGPISHDRFVDALIDLNGGTVIQVGQSIRLP